MIIQIAIFSKMTALTQLHFILSISIALVGHMIVLGIIQKQKLGFFDIYASFNSLLATIILIYISNILKIPDQILNK